MICRGIISAIDGEQYRVQLPDGRVSGLLPLLLLVRLKEDTVKLTAGDPVAVAFFGSSLADGVVLGKVVAV